MTVGVLVRRNVLDPVRSRTIWILLGVFGLLFGGMGYFLGNAPVGALSEIAALVMSQLAPLTAFAMTYDSVAGPRQSGSLRVMLSYPYTRREFILGTLVGRMVIVALAVVVGVLAGTITTLVFGGSVDFGTLLPVLGFSVLLGISIVGLTIGLSANVRSSSRAAVLAFGAYLMFTGFWSFIPAVVRYFLNGFSFPAGSPPGWAIVWNHLNPMTTFNQAMGVLVSGGVPEAFYQSVGFTVAVLVGWFVLFVVLALVGFDRTDL